jgi:hypothetical protein
MIDLAEDYPQCTRALHALGLTAEWQQHAARAGVDGRDGLLSFIQERQLPAVMLDVLAYDDAVQQLSASDVHLPSHVNALAPTLVCPHRIIETRWPIAVFVSGDVDDPCTLGVSPTQYILIRDLHDNQLVHCFEITDKDFIAALTAAMPLNDALAASKTPARWMEWYAALASLGIVMIKPLKS